MSIDWSKMAAPQTDYRDTTWLLQLAAEKWKYVPGYAGGPRWMGLELLSGKEEGSNAKSAPLDDARLQAVEPRLKAVQEIRDALILLDHFSPLMHVQNFGRGCTSGHDKPSIGGRIGCYVTIDDPTGCAEGIVHELAHQRLHCMGVDLDGHDGTLFVNDSVERFFSPIRRDRLRPMCAPVHGIYAYTWVLEIDLSAEDGHEYLKQNVPKVRHGLLEIEKGVIPTEAGEAFFSSFFAWGSDLVRRGEARLRELNLSEVMWEGWEDGKAETAAAAASGR